MHQTQCWLLVLSTGEKTHNNISLMTIYHRFSFMFVKFLLDGYRDTNGEAYYSLFASPNHNISAGNKPFWALNKYLTNHWSVHVTLVLRRSWLYI